MYDEEGFWTEDAIKLSVRYRRARKEHRCWSCGKPIKPGQQYVNVVWKVPDEPGVNVEKRHLNMTACPVYEAFPD